MRFWDENCVATTIFRSYIRCLSRGHHWGCQCRSAQRWQRSLLLPSQCDGVAVEPLTNNVGTHEEVTAWTVKSAWRAQSLAHRTMGTKARYTITLGNSLVPEASSTVNQCGARKAKPELYIVADYLLTIMLSDLGYVCHCVRVRNSWATPHRSIQPWRGLFGW